MSEPWNLTAAQRQQFREAHAEAKRNPLPPCDECGCLPDQPWGCGCSNEDCPCSEAEDEECE